MKDEDRSYIHSQALFERALRRVEEGDNIIAEARYATLEGNVQDVRASDPGDGNYIVDVTAKNGPKSNTYTIVIDYEGAFESEYDYYVPYIVAATDLASLGDVTSLAINGEIIAEDALPN